MDRFNECLSDAITAYRLTAYSDENMPLNDENIYESGFEAGWNAFNESKQSVIENIKLSWNGGHYTSTLFNIDYNIVYSPVSKCYYVMYGDDYLDGNYHSKDAAKHAANEDYKERIKKALGL